MLLHRTFRSLSRPSSPSGSQASAINLYSLDHIIFSVSIRIFTHPACQALCSCAPRMKITRLLQDVFSPPSSFSAFASYDCVSLPCFFQRSSVFPDSSQILHERTQVFTHVLMEIRGFEPLTLGLQSRCSSQLSYIPVPALAYTLKGRKGPASIQQFCLAECTPLLFPFS